MPNWVGPVSAEGVLLALSIVLNRPLAWGLLGLSTLALLVWFAGWLRERATPTTVTTRPPQRRLGSDNDPLLLDIEAERFHPFDYQALIVATKFTLRNQSAQPKRAMSLKWVTHQEPPHFMPDIEVVREMERVKRDLNEFRSRLGAGEDQIFWGVNAFPWNAEGGEPEYAVTVKDELGHEYGVTRVGKPPRKYWRVDTLFGAKNPQPDEIPTPQRKAYDAKRSKITSRGGSIRNQDTAFDIEDSEVDIEGTDIE